MTNARKDVTTSVDVTEAYWTCPRFSPWRFDDRSIQRSRFHFAAIGLAASGTTTPKRGFIGRCDRSAVKALGWPPKLDSFDVPEECWQLPSQPVSRHPKTRDYFLKRQLSPLKFLNVVKKFSRSSAQNDQGSKGGSGSESWRKQEKIHYI